MIDTPEKRDITKEEAHDAIQVEILNSLKELKDLQSQIGHSEAKRLDLDAASYPLLVEDYTNESEAMRKSYSAHKRIKDSMIALAAQVTVENMLKQQVEEMEGENNG